MTPLEGVDLLALAQYGGRRPLPGARHHHAGTRSGVIAASRVAIAAALVAFLAGSTLGLAMGVGWLTPLWRPAHAHLQSLGFVTLMIQGVAYHALPRFRGVPFRRPGLALIQVIATVVAVTGMTLGWGFRLGPAWFAAWGGLAWLANVGFVALGVEVLFRPRRPMRS